MLQIILLIVAIGFLCFACYKIGYSKCEEDFNKEIEEINNYIFSCIDKMMKENNQEKDEKIFQEFDENT